MKRLLFAAIALLIFSCSGEDTKSICADLSYTNTAWLNDLKNTMDHCSCEQSLIRGSYGGNTVFFVDVTDGLCNGYMSVSLYNCYGRVVRSFTGAEYAQLYTVVTPEEILYICSD